MTAVQIAEELARLHRLVSWFDTPVPLPAEAVTGHACVWCLIPADSTAVDLESAADYPQRGCLSCYSARLAWHISWYEWHSHVAECFPCKQGRMCFVGRGRRILHELTAGPAGKEPPACFSCHRTLLAQETAIPVRWEGEASFHLGYAHPGGCARKGAAL
ncbi:hypothetical protein [Streptomyces sp. NPDC004658]|uniref:hypothetical protein n=1 Tax=Streptomyces sp. NPDC004658 TaxID=3154672 RepID=UPI0033A66577